VEMEGFHKIAIRAHAQHDMRGLGNTPLWPDTPVTVGRAVTRTRQRGMQTGAYVFHGFGR